MKKILRKFTAFLFAAIMAFFCVACAPDQSKNSENSESSEKQQEQQEKQFIFYDSDYVSVKEYETLSFDSDGNIAMMVTSRKTTWIRFFENGQIEVSQQTDKYVDGAWQIGQRAYEYGWYLIVEDEAYAATAMIKAIFWTNDYQSTENAMITGIKLGVYDDGKTLDEWGGVFAIGGLTFTLVE